MPRTSATRTLRSPGSSAVARRDEDDLALGQAHAFALGGSPHEDLAALHTIDAGLVVDALVQGRRPQHLHRERAGVARDAGCRLRGAEQVVERSGHEAAVETSDGTLVRGRVRSPAAGDA